MPRQGIVVWARPADAAAFTTAHGAGACSTTLIIFVLSSPTARALPGPGFLAGPMRASRLAGSCSIAQGVAGRSGE